MAGEKKKLKVVVICCCVDVSDHFLYSVTATNVV